MDQDGCLPFLPGHALPSAPVSSWTGLWQGEEQVYRLLQAAGEAGTRRE